MAVLPKNRKELNAALAEARKQGRSSVQKRFEDMTIASAKRQAVSEVEMFGGAVGAGIADAIKPNGIKIPGTGVRIPVSVLGGGVLYGVGMVTGQEDAMSVGRGAALGGVYGYTRDVASAGIKAKSEEGSES